MTGWVNLERSSPISRHLSICSEAKDSTYVRDIDLKSWAEMPGKGKKFAASELGIDWKVDLKVI